MQRIWSHIGERDDLSVILTRWRRWDRRKTLMSLLDLYKTFQVTLSKSPPWSWSCVGKVKVQPLRSESTTFFSIDSRAAAPGEVLEEKASGREELADGLMTPSLCGQLSRKLTEEKRKANQFLEATYKQHQQLQHKHQRWAGSTLISCCLWGKQGRVILGPHLGNLSLENMNWDSQTYKSPTPPSNPPPPSPFLPLPFLLPYSLHPLISSFFSFALLFQPFSLYNILPLFFLFHHLLFLLLLLNPLMLSLHP